MLRLRTRINLPRGVSVPPGARVLNASIIGAALSAESIVKAAQEQAQAMISQAHASAQAIEASIREEVQRTAWDAVRTEIERTTRIYRQALKDFEDAVGDMALSAAHKLLLDVPPDWPCRSSTALLLQERAEFPNAVLHLNPQDLAQLDETVIAKTGWRAQANPALARGQCDLVTSQGAVKADYTGSLSALFATLESSPAAADSSAHNPISEGTQSP